MVASAIINDLMSRILGERGKGHGGQSIISTWGGS